MVVGNGCLVGVLSEPLIALIFVMGCDWVLVVGWVGREMGLVVVWLVGARSTPGIPRSRRCAGSRPFRAAKGAVRVVMMEWKGGLVGRGGWRVV